MKCVNRGIVKLTGGKLVSCQTSKVGNFGSSGHLLGKFGKLGRVFG